MKKLLLAIVLLPLGVAAQTATPAKGSTTIILTTTDSLAVAYTKLSRLLLNEGYMIDKADKEVAYINTDYKNIQLNRGVELSLKISLIPGPGGVIITERGEAKMPYLGQFPAACRGANGSPVQLAWAELYRVSALYSGAKAAYK